LLTSCPIRWGLTVKDSDPRRFLHGIEEEPFTDRFFFVLCLKANTVQQLGSAFSLKYQKIVRNGHVGKEVPSIAKSAMRIAANEYHIEWNIKAVKPYRRR
jgi:hypothetical protein